MQDFGKMCRATLLGLILFCFGFFLPCQLDAKRIWENVESGEEFVFAGFDKIFFYTALNSDLADQSLKKVLSDSVQKRGRVTFVQGLEDQIIGAIGESKLFVHVIFIATEDANINGLHFSATSGADATQNHGTSSKSHGNLRTRSTV